MISKLKMSNVMGFETFENPFPFPQVTVILGKNDTCKTALLKMIYSVGKAKELYIKQTVHYPDISFKNIISKKVVDTMQMFLAAKYQNTKVWDNAHVTVMTYEQARRKLPFVV